MATEGAALKSGASARKRSSRPHHLPGSDGAHGTLEGKTPEFQNRPDQGSSAAALKAGASPSGPYRSPEDDKTISRSGENH